MQKQQSETTEEATNQNHNPKTEEIRCRICYLTFKPLITICQCSGSIEYVHEQCVVEWISKQMELSDILEVPKCEICKAEYNAKLIVGSKKISPDLLFNKIRALKIKELLISLFFFLGSLVSIWIIVSTFFNQISFLLKFLHPQNTLRVQELLSFKDVFTQLIFPLTFLNSGHSHLKKRRHIWKESQVQVVELILTPKLILKE